MKKRFSLLLCAVMALAMIVPTAAAAGVPASPTAGPVTVDGRTVPVAGYQIGENNYFKLRDLAAAVSGTAYQFDVAFDPAARRVDMTTGAAYTAVGGELAGTASAPGTAAQSQWTLWVDGRQADVSVYSIGGNNYYKLRDVGELAGFGVGYNQYAKTARIVTSKDLADGVHVDADPASPTGYTATFVLADNGYQSVKLNGNFTFVPVITEETDYDNEYIPQMDENGMAIKGEDGKSVVEVGRDMSAEKENIKADTLRVDSKELPVVYTAYQWAKSVQYEGVVTSLEHWTNKVDFEMEKDAFTGKWILSMPLPSGAYTYTYTVTKDGKEESINDPANQEQWYTKVVPSEEDEGFAGTNQGYRQAFAKLEESYVSCAYVPFDAEKQVYDWDFLHPVSDKVCEGTRQADVAYKTPTDTYTSPEVAQAHQDGLSDSDGLVDFITDTGYLGVYLPKGYDPNRKEPYKVVYYAHGGRGAQSLPQDTIRIADNAMEDGVDDFLLVTFNCYASATDKAWPSWFDWKVLVNLTENIIPFMEENYNVGTTEADRAICGFSAGGAVSHYALLYYSDWFDYFGIWGCGESTTVPGDFNAYVDYIRSYEDYKGKGLEDETVLIGAGSYDVARAGGYTVDGTKDAVQTIRYDHTYRAYMGLRDIVQIEDLHWCNGNSNHDMVTGSWLANVFFNEYLWK